ncbi:MAG: DnaD domain protein [Bacilli bacterium]
MNISRNDVDWKNILTKKYLSYDLNELDVMVLLVSDNVLIQEPKTLLTCDILTSYMKAGRDQIDQSLTKLISKKYLTVINVGTTIYSSLEEFKDRLFNDFVKDIVLKSKEGRDPNTVSTSLYASLEELQGTTLSPIERDTVTRWLQEGADEGMIKEAAQKALMKSGHISFKMAERYILDMERSQTRKDIGASTVNEDTRRKEELRDLFNNSDWTYHGDK